MKPSEASKKLEFHSKQICHGCMHPSMVGWCENHCRLPEAFKMAISALEKQEEDRWISVTERLPKPNTNVIMQCRAKGYKEKYRYFQTIGCYIPVLTVKSEEKWNDDCEGVEIYDEKTDSFYCKEGWYEESTQGDGDYMSWYMGANVIAWRPLPELYMEEES